MNNVKYMMDVIYLDTGRKFGNAWCLKMYDKKRGTNVRMTLYEMHKVYKPYKFVIK